jgi:hypothetical protein
VEEHQPRAARSDSVAATASARQRKGQEPAPAPPDYAAPQAKVDAIVALLQPGRFPLLE